ncbi:MAG: hypothetical protein Q9181_000646 [Wetmoreana brouardii]
MKPSPPRTASAMKSAMKSQNKEKIVENVSIPYQSYLARHSQPWAELTRGPYLPVAGRGAAVCTSIADSIPAQVSFANVNEVKKINPYAVWSRPLPNIPMNPPHSCRNPPLDCSPALPTSGYLRPRRDSELSRIPKPAISRLPRPSTGSRPTGIPRPANTSSRLPVRSSPVLSPELRTSASTSPPDDSSPMLSSGPSPPSSPFSSPEESSYSPSPPSSRSSSPEAQPSDLAPKPSRSQTGAFQANHFNIDFAKYFNT